MDEKMFNYILKNQNKWKEQFDEQHEERQAIRRILNRKQISKQSKSKDWIKNELIKSLQLGELEELKETLADKGFRQLDLFE